jgi:hypothetical protein
MNDECIDHLVTSIPYGPDAVARPHTSKNASSELELSSQRSLLALRLRRAACRDRQCFLSFQLLLDKPNGPSANAVACCSVSQAQIPTAGALSSRTVDFQSFTPYNRTTLPFAGQGFTLLGKARLGALLLGS